MSHRAGRPASYVALRRTRIWLSDGWRTPPSLCRQSLQRGGGEKAPRQAQAADDGAAVAFLGEIARVDRRGVAGPVRFRLDIAAREGPHLPGAGAEARGLLELADLASLEAARREGDLH